VHGLKISQIESSSHGGQSLKHQDFKEDFKVCKAVLA